MICLLSVFHFYVQLISQIEGGKLETEGLLRIPGVAARVKVKWLFSLGKMVLCCPPVFDSLFIFDNVCSVASLKLRYLNKIVTSTYSF